MAARILSRKGPQRAFLSLSFSLPPATWAPSSKTFARGGRCSVCAKAVAAGLASRASWSWGRGVRSSDTSWSMCPTGSALRVRSATWSSAARTTCGATCAGCTASASRAPPSWPWPAPSAWQPCPPSRTLSSTSTRATPMPTAVGAAATTTNDCSSVGGRSLSSRHPCPLCFTQEEAERCPVCFDLFQPARTASVPRVANILLLCSAVKKPIWRGIYSGSNLVWQVHISALGACVMD